MYTDRESENPLEADGPTIKFHQTLLGNPTVLETLVSICILFLWKISFDENRNGASFYGWRYAYLQVFASIAESHSESKHSQWSGPA